MDYILLVAVLENTKNKNKMCLKKKTSLPLRLFKKKLIYGMVPYLDINSVETI